MADPFYADPPPKPRGTISIKSPQSLLGKTKHLLPTGRFSRDTMGYSCSEQGISFPLFFQLGNQCQGPYPVWIPTAPNISKTTHTTLHAVYSRVNAQGERYDLGPSPWPSAKGYIAQLEFCIQDHFLSERISVSSIFRYGSRAR